MKLNLKLRKWRPSQRFLIAVFTCLLLGQLQAQAQAQTQAQTSDKPITDKPMNDDVATSSINTSEYNVKLNTKESRVLFGLFGQISSFTRQGAALQGYNLEGLADYALTDSTAVQLSLNQSLDTANGISVLFTGLRLGAAYAWWGQFTHRNSLLEVNGTDTLNVRSPDASMFVTDVGIEQYLFNGSDRIVPATGLSLGSRFDKTLWHMRLSAMVRYGSLVIAKDPVTMLTAGVGTLIRF